MEDSINNHRSKSRVKHGSIDHLPTHKRSQQQIEGEVIVERSGQIAMGNPPPKENERQLTNGSLQLAKLFDLILKRERGQQVVTLYVTGRDTEQEQRLAPTFDQTTATWRLIGDRTDIARTKERQDILDLLTEQAPLGMSPRQVAEALQKNYHTVRSLLRKMEGAYEVQHDHNRYFATPKNLPLERAEQSPSRLTDDSDYGDDTTDHSVSTPSQVRQYAPLRRDADVQATPADHLMDTEDWQTREYNRLPQDGDVVQTTCGWRDRGCFKSVLRG
jgi:hypothetical protein